MKKNTSLISAVASVCGALACCALNGCSASPAEEGAASGATDLTTPLAVVMSETRGTPVERAGGTETDSTTTYRIKDEAATVQTIERLETASGMSASGMTAVDQRTRVSRVFTIDNAANQMTIRNGSQQVTIRQDNLQRIFINGRLVANEDDATQVAYTDPVLRQAPVSVLVHADRRLADLPEHRGAVGRAIRRVGRVILRGTVCRLMYGTWRCPTPS